jgi:hypothetical protein
MVFSHKTNISPSEKKSSVASQTAGNKTEVTTLFEEPSLEALQPKTFTGLSHTSFASPGNINNNIQNNLAPSIQTKLTIGEPDDEYEKEADSLADQVMRMPENKIIHRACNTCDEEKIQKKPWIQTQSDQNNQASSATNISQLIQSGNGNSLPADTRSFMESRFGADFSGVRIHSDSQAAESASVIRAKAFTSGNNIVFGQGQYNPSTSQGKWLLAHELAHVGQQNSSVSVRSKVEQEAGEAATGVMSGKKVQLKQKKNPEELYLFGEPENVPDITYISTQGEQGFLNSAVQYHEAWGLAPRRINSIEDVINDLATGNGHINRIRIVLHAANIGVYSSLFTNEPRFSIQEARLNAWAQSDVRGLENDLGNLLVLNQANIDGIIGSIRNRSAAVLSPFGLDIAGSPGGSLLNLFTRVAELTMVNHFRTPLNANQMDVYIDTLNRIIASISQQVQADHGATVQQVVAFQNAVSAANWVWGPFQIHDPTVNILREANRAVAGGFRNTLNNVRARFDGNSWIDLRGCNVGTQVSYLQAVANFFGSPGALPHISGPNWFQIFPIFGSRSLSTVNQMLTFGRNRVINNALDKWSVLTGVRQQMDTLRMYYQNELLRRQILANYDQTGNAPNLTIPPEIRFGLFPPIFTNIPLPLADQFLLNLIRTDSLQSMNFSLPEPEPRRPLFQLPKLRNLDVLQTMIREAIARLSGNGAEFRFYLESAMVLPVFEGGNPQDFNLYVYSGLQSDAMSIWLRNQWATEAPGLQQLLSNADQLSENNRRIQALVEQRVGSPAPRGAQMVFPPDPAYWAHIIHT